MVRRQTFFIGLMALEFFDALLFTGPRSFSLASIAYIPGPYNVGFVKYYHFEAINYFIVVLIIKYFFNTSTQPVFSSPGLKSNLDFLTFNRNFRLPNKSRILL